MSCCASLWQFFIKLSEEEKNRKLNDLLDVLEFNQVCYWIPGCADIAVTQH